LRDARLSKREAVEAANSRRSHSIFTERPVGSGPSAKGPVDVLVIDHAEKPTEDDHSGWTQQIENRPHTFSDLEPRRIDHEVFDVPGSIVAFEHFGPRRQAMSRDVSST